MSEDKQALFCVCCFASDTGGSWGEVCLPYSCINCGAGGSTIELKEWQVKEIRRNASWVGRRYYPNDDDLKIDNELKMLRSLQTEFHGRTATLNDGGWWDVRQATSPNSYTSISVKADSQDEALLKTKDKLPYVVCDHGGHVTIK